MFGSVSERIQHSRQHSVQHSASSWPCNDLAISWYLQKGNNSPRVTNHFIMEPCCLFLSFYLKQLYCYDFILFSTFILNPYFQFKSFCGSVTDVDYHDWFCGTSIHQNVREVVREVLIPVLVEDFLPTSLSSLEEMFQMAPSAMMSQYCQHQYVGREKLKWIIFSENSKKGM